MAQLSNIRLRNIASSRLLVLFSLICSAKDTVPEGKFVWRIGDNTLRNFNPLVLEIDQDGVSKAVMNIESVKQ